MDIRIDSNLQSVAAQYQSSAQAVARAIETGLDDGAQVVLNAKVRQVNKTYARAIPKRRNGKPKWKRSGAFLRGQGIKSSRGMREIGTQNDAMKYEGRLATLPVSKDGVNRRNAAAAEAHRIVLPQVGPVFEAAVRNALIL